MSTRFVLCKLRSAVWYVTLAALFFLSIYSFPVEAAFRCERSSKMMIGLMQDGYAYFSTGAVNKGYAVQLYLNQYGNFKIIGVDKDLQACELMVGSDWKFLTVTRI